MLPPASTFYLLLFVFYPTVSLFPHFRCSNIKMASDENDSVNMVPTIVVLPFTYDVEGLKVEEYLREAGGRLYDLLVGTTPLSSPAEDESAKFFAAQATHYDLGQGGTEQETKEALISAIKEEEQTELQVPEAIRHLEERMASLFERKRQVLADELALQDEWTQQEVCIMPPLKACITNH